MKKEVKHIKAYNKDVISWEEILENFNDSINNQELIKFKDFGFYVSHRADRIKRLKPVMENLKCKYAHLYFSVMSKAKTFGAHKDNLDVWFWQCQGKTKWKVKRKEYILKPGDLIFVPKGIVHNVTSLTPRAGISMSNVKSEIEKEN